jgi:hypothetical protein
MHPFMRDINGNPFPGTPMGRIAGRWPGNETDEEIEQALNMTNERKNITQPPDWWQVFEGEAKKAGVSLSEWIGEACLQRLPNKVRKQLSERPPANRPPKAKD